MIDIIVPIGMAILGMILGFMYYVLKRIEENITKLFVSHEKLYYLYNDLDRRMLIMETKVKERRHILDMEESHG